MDHEPPRQFGGGRGEPGSARQGRGADAVVRTNGGVDTTSVRRNDGRWLVQSRSRAADGRGEVVRRGTQWSAAGSRPLAAQGARYGSRRLFSRRSAAWGFVVEGRRA